MPARKRCTLSSRGVVSGWPTYNCSAPPNSAITANRNRQTCTMRWLAGIRPPNRCVHAYQATSLFLDGPIPYSCETERSRRHNEVLLRRRSSNHNTAHLSQGSRRYCVTGTTRLTIDASARVRWHVAEAMLRCRSGQIGTAPVTDEDLARRAGPSPRQLASLSQRTGGRHWHLRPTSCDRA